MDAVGALALAGAPLLASYRSYCGGHALNLKAVRALLADSEAWEWSNASRVMARRRHAHADSGMMAAAFAASRN
jgi:UDP-3-O-[3-hydroxymyristoyl] N-acetylglucosamine deacetylase